MLKSLVRQGVGVGILSSIDVEDEFQAGEFVYVRVSDPGFKRLTRALCVGRARQLSAAANALVAMLEREVTGVVGDGTRSEYANGAREPSGG